MRNKKKDDLPYRPAAPCRTLTAAERAEVEKQLRDSGLLRAATEAELEEMRKQKAHAAARRP